MKMINSETLQTPETAAKILSPYDLGVYVKICQKFHSYKVYKEYPVELLSFELDIPHDKLQASVERILKTGLVRVQDGFVSVASHKRIYPTNYKQKSLYLGDYPGGVSKFGVSRKLKERLSSLCSYQPFKMHTVYHFEAKGVADHLEKLLKNGLPLERQNYPGGTECFLTKHLPRAMTIVDSFLLDNYCGDVRIEKRELGEMFAARVA